MTLDMLLCIKTSEGTACILLYCQSSSFTDFSSYHSLSDSRVGDFGTEDTSKHTKYPRLNQPGDSGNAAYHFAIG